MSYVKTQWVNGDTITADKLNHIEAGIEANETENSLLKSQLEALPYSVYSAANVTDGKCLNASGVETSQSGWSITEYLRIKDCATYYIKNGVTSNNVRSCFYDAGKGFISAFQTKYDGEHLLFAPSNAKYVRFSIQTADKNDFTYSEKILLDVTDGSVLPSFIYGNELIRSFSTEMISGEYYNNQGVVTTSSSWKRSKLYPVNPGDAVKVKNAYGTYAVLFDETQTFVSAKHVNELSDQIFIVPSGVSYIGINVVIANESGYKCLVNDVPLGALYSPSWMLTNGSIWAEKTYISHGDSITWRDGKPWGTGMPHEGEIAKGYQTIFSENVGLASYTNSGKSGWSMAVVNGNGVVNTVLSVSDYSVYDLCTIACGTNDFKLNVPLGTLGVIGDTTFDDTTFYGAYRKAVEYILTSSPTIRLVLMTPLQRDNAGYDVNYTNSAGCKLIDYVNAVKAVGDMYGLPVCDMYGNSGFTKKTLSTYTLDGLHPNEEGYERMGNYLTGFLNAVGN